MSSINETGVTNVFAGMINKTEAINKQRFTDNMLTIVSENE